jgi:hypothetical protein
MNGCVVRPHRRAAFRRAGPAASAAGAAALAGPSVRPACRVWRHNGVATETKSGRAR